jgi:cell wall assembly regulator SMI1
MPLKNTNDQEEFRLAWQRIQRWFETHAPEWTDGPTPLFLPPATEQSVKHLEEHLGISLPDQLRALVFTSNGCRRGDYPLPMKQTTSTLWRTMSVEEIAVRWDSLSSLAATHPFRYQVRVRGPVRASWWIREWIPFADCGMGDVVCADMNPAPGGMPGQLVLYEHDFEERKVLYASLLAWLSECAAGFERDEYVYIEGVGLSPSTATDD